MVMPYPTPSEMSTSSNTGSMPTMWLPGFYPPVYHAGMPPPSFMLPPRPSSIASEGITTTTETSTPMPMFAHALIPPSSGATSEAMPSLPFMCSLPSGTYLMQQPLSSTTTSSAPLYMGPVLPGAPVPSSSICTTNTSTDEATDSKRLRSTDVESTSNPANHAIAST